MVGWVRMKVRGQAGTAVTLRHAEVLDKEGNFYTQNLRRAKQTNCYILKGEGEEVFEPHFTFQGFRYVAVTGYPGEILPDAFVGVVIHSATQPVGSWESSNAMLNRLQHNILWSQKGNFVDIPTDCPQRDERFGWTGDAQVFARTAAYNMDVATFFEKWLGDLSADQKPDGSMPYIIPDVLTKNAATVPSAAAGWGDAAVIVPWMMYVTYGDVAFLERQYPSMKRWVDYIRTRAPDLIWREGWQFGDWLAYAAPPGEAFSYPGATTGKDFIGTAFFAHSCDLLANTARVLGKEEDARAYAELFTRIKVAFNREFVTPAGRVSEATQTAYALALHFHLLPESLQAEAARRLVADIATHQNHLTTGFLGTPYLCPVLSAHGRTDVAYLLLMQDTYPSWLYPVKMGATTIWEHWDSIKPDGSFYEPRMNSFNHYAYGAIGEWLYSGVAGIDIDPTEPGYKHIIIEPHPGGGLAWVSATVKTLFGEVASGWRVDDGTIRAKIRVPPNTHATVRLPEAMLSQVAENGMRVSEARGVHAARQRGDTVEVEIGSGEYEFVYAFPSASKGTPAN
jgi:alpha-L-rhamnosidase